MKTSISLILVLVASSLAFSEPVFLGLFSDSKGMQLKWLAEPEEIAQTQSWDGMIACPFDVTKLIAIAYEHVKQSNPNSEKIQMDAFYLQRADKLGRVDMLKDKWFLTVSFSGTTGNTPSTVRVLMNGKVIEPVKQEKAEQPPAPRTRSPERQEEP